MEKKVVISKDTKGKELFKYLESKGYEVMLHGPVLNVDKRIACHPDLIYCKLTMGETFVGDQEKLGEKYPEDIRYNGCSTGKYFIHNLKYTDEELLRRAKDSGLILLNVPQGYARCNILPVDSDSVITSDKGVIEALKGKLDVLEVTEKEVELEGFPYGFIGGCAGRVGDEVLFNGDLTLHPDFERIVSFITSKGLKVKYFTGYKLSDVGSIIEL